VISGRAPVAALRGRALAAPLVALLAAGCGPSDSTADRDDAPRLAATSGEQVARERKSDRLAFFAARPAHPEDAAARAPAMAEPSARPTAHDRSGLRRFYAALAEIEGGARRKPVTVLHLGDSHIASDRFTADLRLRFQERFGDAGRGMLMPGFPFDYYRAQGVRFAKGGAWTASSSLLREPGPYGVTGVRVATDEPEAWLRLTSEGGPFEWAEVTFATGPGQGAAVLAVDDAEMEVDTASERASIKTVRVRYKGSRVTVRAKGDAGLAVLSWAIGSDRPGVRYVNLGIPGATADIAAHWNDAIVAADLARLDPDLIVLGYGTNEGFDDGLDIAAYERRVEALLRRLSRAAPGAAMAVLGPADGARFPRSLRAEQSPEAIQAADCRPLLAAEAQDYRTLVASADARLARWHPPPKLGAVRGALARVAQRRGAFYWDWSGLMGGECGIHAWAKAEPPLATSDHVHITAEGSRRSAAALFEAMMGGYAAHRTLASR